MAAKNSQEYVQHFRIEVRWALRALLVIASALLGLFGKMYSSQTTINDVVAADHVKLQEVEKKATETAATLTQHLLTNKTGP